MEYLQIIIYPLQPIAPNQISRMYTHLELSTSVGEEMFEHEEEEMALAHTFQVDSGSELDTCRLHRSKQSI